MVVKTSRFDSNRNRKSRLNSSKTVLQLAIFLISLLPFFWHVCWFFRVTLISVFVGVIIFLPLNVVLNKPKLFIHRIFSTFFLKRTFFDTKITILKYRNRLCGSKAYVLSKAIIFICSVFHKKRTLDVLVWKRKLSTSALNLRWNLSKNRPIFIDNMLLFVFR